MSQSACLKCTPPFHWRASAGSRCVRARAVGPPAFARYGIETAAWFSGRKTAIAAPQRSPLPPRRHPSLRACHSHPPNLNTILAFVFTLATRCRRHLVTGNAAQPPASPSRNVSSVPPNRAVSMCVRSDVASRLPPTADRSSALNLPEARARLCPLACVRPRLDPSRAPPPRSCDVMRLSRARPIEPIRSGGR